MPQANVIATNWTAGEFSPKLLARVDLAKYSNGAEQLENFLVMPWGGLRKRGGTVFVANTKDDGEARLEPFVFSTTQAYMLEFGASYFRIHTSAGVVTETGVTITGATQANPVVITAAGHGYSNGDRVIITGVLGMTELNNREFEVANQTASTFELSGIDGTGFTAYSSAGTSAKIVEVSTPYPASDVTELDFTQSANVLYITHPDYAPRVLNRVSATSWTIAEAAIVNGPFRDINTDDSITLYLSGGSATSYGTYAEGSTGITMTASSSLFESGHLGSLWRLYTNDEGGGWAQLVADDTPIAVDRLYENAGNVYVVTAKVMDGSNWDASQRPPTHLRGTVRAYENARTDRYADFKYIHDASVIVKVTDFTSDTVVEVSIERNEAPAEVIGSGNATSFWEEGAFSITRGWPAKVHLFEERLWFGRTATDTQTVWSSRTGAFLDFLDGADADDAITFTISSNQVEAIQWINGGRVLSIGTTDGEYIVAASTASKPLTPEEVSVRRQTSYGTADDVAPVRVGEVLLFAQRYGDNDNLARVVREHAYSFENDGYLGRNVTILSDHIMGAGVKRFAYQASPYSIVWAARSDGEAAALTYERDQDVLAWQRQILGGTSDAGGTKAKIESIAAIPGSIGDDVWFVVQRYVDGGTVRHIERTTIGLDDDGDIDDAQFLDAHLAYDGSAVSTLTGFWHLRSETVRIFADGEDRGTATVSATGSVSLGASYSKVVIGYGYTAKILSLRAEAGVASGTAQGKRKRISEVTIRLYQSYGGKIGGESTRTDDIFGSTVALFTGDKRIEFPDGWTYDGRFYMEHSEAYPFIPTGLIAEIRGSG